MDALKLVDAYGKNFSFLLDVSKPRLAPLYGLLASIAWPELNTRLAMPIGRVGTIEELDRETLARFSEDAGITLPFLRRRGIALADRIMARCDRNGLGRSERTALQARVIQQTLKRRIIFFQNQKNIVCELEGLYRG